MKQAFQMRTMLLSALLCALGFGAKAQTASGENSTSCDAIVRFSAIDPTTCTVVATDPSTYTIPAGTLLGTMSIPISWTPAAPGVSFFIAAEVADAACGFPGVLVGIAEPGCSIPVGFLSTCPACAPSRVDNDSPVFHPGSGSQHYSVFINP